MNTANDKLELALNGMSELIYKEGATKKSLLAHAEQFMDIITESGELDNLKAMGVIAKMKDYLSVVESRLRKEALADLEGTKEDYTVKGVTFSVRQGSERLNYSDDHVIKELEAQLKERKELVKVATKSSNPVYDSEGTQVEPVSSSFTSDSIVIKY